MLCLAHNLGKWRTEALGQKVWRYRFDLVADNLNSQGAAIGTFHGKQSLHVDVDFYDGSSRRRYPVRYGVGHVPKDEYFSS